MFFPSKSALPTSVHSCQSKIITPKLVLHHQKAELGRESWVQGAEDENTRSVKHNLDLRPPEQRQQWRRSCEHPKIVAKQRVNGPPRGQPDAFFFFFTPHPGAFFLRAAFVPLLSSFRPRGRGGGHGGVIPACTRQPFTSRLFSKRTIDIASCR